MAQRRRRAGLKPRRPSGPAAAAPGGEGVPVLRPGPRRLGARRLQSPRPPRGGGVGQGPREPRRAPGVGVWGGKYRPRGGRGENYS